MLEQAKKIQNFFCSSKVELEPGAGAETSHQLRLRPKCAGSGSATLVLSTTAVFDVALGADIADTLKHTPIDPLLARAHGVAMNSKGQDSFNAIRTFGPACGVEGGFEGTIHLLLKFNDYKDAMIANAKAGGDNAARGMIVGMIMGAARKAIPQMWKNNIKNL